MIFPLKDSKILRGQNLVVFYNFQSLLEYVAPDE